MGAMDRRYIKGGSVVWALNGVFSRGLWAYGPRGRGEGAGRGRRGICSVGLKRWRY